MSFVTLSPSVAAGSDFGVLAMLAVLAVLAVDRSVEPTTGASGVEGRAC
jgi:hypothetical protein